MKRKYWEDVRDEMDEFVKKFGKDRFAIVDFKYEIKWEDTDRCLNYWQRKINKAKRK